MIKKDEVVKGLEKQLEKQATVEKKIDFATIAIDKLFREMKGLKDAIKGFLQSKKKESL